MIRPSRRSYPVVALYPHDGRHILSSRRGLFEGLWTDTTKVAVALHSVIQHFNVMEDIGTGQFAGFVDPFSDTLIHVHRPDYAAMHKIRPE